MNERSRQLLELKAKRDADKPKEEVATEKPPLPSAASGPEGRQKKTIKGSQSQTTLKPPSDLQKRPQTAAVSRIKPPSQPLQAQFNKPEVKPAKPVDKQKLDQLAKPKDVKVEPVKSEKASFQKSDKYLLQKFDREF